MLPELEAAIYACEHCRRRNSYAARAERIICVSCGAVSYHPLMRLWSGLAHLASHELAMLTLQSGDAQEIRWIRQVADLLLRGRAEDPDAPP